MKTTKRRDLDELRDARAAVTECQSRVDRWREQLLSTPEGDETVRGYFKKARRDLKAAQEWLAKLEAEQ